MIKRNAGALLWVLRSENINRKSAAKKLSGSVVNNWDTFRLIYHQSNPESLPRHRSGNSMKSPKGKYARKEPFIESAKFLRESYTGTKKAPMLFSFYHFGFKDLRDSGESMIEVSPGKYLILKYFRRKAKKGERISKFERYRAVMELERGKHKQHISSAISDSIFSALKLAVEKARIFYSQDAAKWVNLYDLHGFVFFDTNLNTLPNRFAIEPLAFMKGRFLWDSRDTIRGESNRKYRPIDKQKNKQIPRKFVPTNRLKFYRDSISEYPSISPHEMKGSIYEDSELTRFAVLSQKAAQEDRFSDAIRFEVLFQKRAQEIGYSVYN